DAYRVAKEAQDAARAFIESTYGKDRVFRVTFNEITKRAVQEAFKNPTQINMDLVYAQQARRVLDRIVGYKLSPLLWEKITRGLSAGRVQSVAVRLIVDREKEIEAFEADEYWKSQVLVAKPGAKEKDRFVAELRKIDGQTAKIPDYDAAETVRAALAQAAYRVLSVEEKQRTDSAKAPFNTSLLQQQASTRLRFSAKRTMVVAQQLYEGIELGDQGPVGLITYMRTDAYRVAKEAQDAARAFIESTYGKDWVPETPNTFKPRKGAQAAHEAVRPTDVTRTPDSLKDFLKRDQLRLYRLIWERFVASQMAPAKWAVTEINVEAGIHRLQARGRRLLFPGYLKVLKDEEKAGEEQGLPKVADGDDLEAHRIELSQHFTQPPSRFSEATLVRMLEKEGIGRPSTYAPIISTIQERGYVKLTERKFHATEIGVVVTDLLVQSFPEILEVDFTSQLEDDLDRIEEAQAEWTQVLKAFYKLFEKDLKRAKKEMPNLKENAEPSKEKCDECGGRLLYRINRHGRFLGCENYPKCRATVSVGPNGEAVRPQVTEHACQLCGKPFIPRTGRRGPFLGCSGYPACRNTLSVDDEGNPIVPDPTNETCENCGKAMIVKHGRRGPFLACSGYPECKTTQPLAGGKKSEPKETGESCEKCGKPMVVRYGRRGAFAACSGYPDCRNTKSLAKKEAPDGEKKAPEKKKAPAKKKAAKKKKAPAKKKAAKKKKGE
ncbi:MAG: type I DNA topoisomerase, partial [Planctomycetota bacterium]